MANRPRLAGGLRADSLTAADEIRQSNVMEHRPEPINDAPRERISDSAPEVRRSPQSRGEENQLSLRGGEDIDRG